MNTQTDLAPSLFRCLRWRAGLTQAEVARHMSVGQRAVSAYELGVINGGPALADWRAYRCADWMTEKIERMG